MVGRNPNVTIDPDAEASSTTDTQTAAAVSKSQVRSPSSRGPTTRPFKPISPTLTKSLFRGTGDDESKQRPFGSGKDTTEDQRYRRFLEIKDEIRKRARKIEQAKARNAKIVKLPPLTGIESFCLFVNSWELHALVLVAFLNVAYFLHLGSAIAVACTVHTLFFLFWVSVWMHSRNSNSRRLEDYAELSRNVELAPLVRDCAAQSKADPSWMPHVCFFVVCSVVVPGLLHDFCPLPSMALVGYRDFRHNRWIATTFAANCSRICSRECV